MTRRIAALAMLVALACSMAGCTKPAGEPAAGGSGQAAGAAKPASTDDKIAAAVKAKLAADPGLSKETIAVSVKDGRVALSGTVTDGSARIQAENVARSVPEVFGVDAEKLVAK